MKRNNLCVLIHSYGCGLESLFSLSPYKTTTNKGAETTALTYLISIPLVLQSTVKFEIL